MKSYSFWLLSLLGVLADQVNATWSLVATDRATGQVGGAGATCRTSGVGLSVSEDYSSIPGDGSLAAQAGAINPTDNNAAVAALAAGQTPDQIVDPTNSFIRFDSQWGVVDLDGNKGGFTGPGAILDALDVQGHVKKDYTYSVQGNRLSSDKVVHNAEKEFNKGGKGKNCGKGKGGKGGKGASSCKCNDLADRLMRGLEAGTKDDEGDSRCTDVSGKPPATSAYLFVDHPDGTREPDIDVAFVSQTFDAVQELRRLYDLWRETYPCEKRPKPHERYLPPLPPGIETYAAAMLGSVFALIGLGYVVKKKRYCCVAEEDFDEELEDSHDDEGIKETPKPFLVRRGGVYFLERS